MAVSATTQQISILESARALRPLIESVRHVMDVERRLPKELVKAMVDARLFRLQAPKSLGGFELDPITFGHVIEEVAAMDGSAGWNLMIGNGGALLAGYMPQHVATELFGSDDAIAAGTLAPTGQAPRKWRLPSQR